MASGSVGKRKAERRDCQVRAQMRFPDDRPAIDCLIVNFSASGARVQLREPVELPPRFLLYIPSRPETKNVILRWNNGKEIGLEYATGQSQETDIIELFTRVGELEKRLSALAAPSADVPPGEAARAMPAGATLGLPVESADEIRARIDAVEIIAADATADLERAFRARLDALERLVQRPVEPTGHAVAPDPVARELAERMAAFEERLAHIARQAPQASKAPQASEAPQAPEAPLARDSLREPAPAPEILARLSALEARGNEPQQPAAALDESVLAPIFERISNLEVEMMNMRFGRPEDSQMEARMTRLEASSADIQGALRDVLALLMRREADTRAAG